MKSPHRILVYRGWVLILALLTIMLLPDIVEARRGRSFGGSRRSFRRSKAPKRSRGSSFGKKTNRSRTTAAKRSSFSSPKQRLESVGGRKLSSKKEYTSKYGAPRKTVTQSMPVTGKNGVKTNQNYRLHSYGGYGSGFMTGYLLGTVPWYWSTPFHGAFYYSSPQYHTAKDGSVDVYPGRFSYGKLFVGIIIVGGIIFLLYRIFFRRANYSQLDDTRRSGSFS